MRFHICTQKFATEKFERPAENSSFNIKSFHIYKKKNYILFPACKTKKMEDNNETKRERENCIENW